jgi:ubiquitin-like 1-activating enzyme E1 B
MARNRYAKQSLGTLHQEIKKSRVLMVGAGGIGCELLKNLVLMGFGEIHIVDLDTIDLSNLNRQFLFRHEHIKQPKAHVAKEAALKFNPNAKIISYHANIKDSQFSRAWFKTFDIVFNALDNIDARKYVNRMCISTDVPLIESGTTGFNGQAFIIKKGVTACYECEPIETPKSFPVCTIRNTPSQPIHCIVWAKSYLFTEVFGGGAEAASDLDFAATGENAEDLKMLRDEMLALQKIRDSMGTDSFPALVFNKVFDEDIRASLSMDDMWVGKRAPVPLQYGHFTEAQVPNETSKQDQTVWSKKQCVEVFYDSIQRLAKRVLEGKASGSNSTAIDFDKDDTDTLDFVAATANLRSYIFGIEPKSKFTIKQMAGNIIPAITTTNAVIAGACVLQAIKVFRGEFAKPGSIFMSKSSYRMVSSYQRPPNPHCPVCSAAQTDLTIQPTTATLQSLVESLRSTLDYKNFEIYTDAGLIFDDEDEDEDMLAKRLADLSIRGGSVVRVVQDPRVELLLNVQEDASGNQPLTLGKVDVPTKMSNGHAEHDQPVENGVLPNGTTPAPIAGVKRAAEEVLEGQPSTKVKVTSQSDDVIVID